MLPYDVAMLAEVGGGMADGLKAISATCEYLSQVAG